MISMKKKITTIISGSDQNNFWMLDNLCSNLNKLDINNLVDINIIDIDLKPDQKNKINKIVNSLKTVEWPIKLNFKSKNWKKLLILRPYLREIFPGYKNYIWLDTDTIVQNNDFCYSFSEALKYKSLLMCPENDISYNFEKSNKNFKKLLLNFYKPYGWVYKNNLRFFGYKYAKESLFRPLFNAGVFCLRNNSLYWNIWKKKYLSIVKNSSDDYCLNMDQASLNYSIYEDSSYFGILDVKYNWLLKNKLPLLNKKKMKFYKNQIPHEEISILHYTQFDIKKKYTFQDLNFKNHKFKII